MSCRKTDFVPCPMYVLLAERMGLTLRKNSLVPHWRKGFLLANDISGQFSRIFRCWLLHAKRLAKIIWEILALGASAKNPPRWWWNYPSPSHAKPVEHQKFIQTKSKRDFYSKQTKQSAPVRNFPNGNLKQQTLTQVTPRGLPD